MPSTLKNAKVLLIDIPLEIRELDGDAKVNLDSLQAYDEFLKGEQQYLAELAHKIKQSGTSLVVCQKGIDDGLAYALAKEGILATRRTRKSDLERLSLALHCPVLSTLEDIESKNLGSAEEVSVQEILGENYIFVEGCVNPKAVTLFLKGSTKHVLDEIERAVEDAIGDLSSLLRSKQIVAGGGAIELALHKELLSFAKTFSGKEQLIITSFAESFLIVPKILCQNSGLDEIETMASLISSHERGEHKSGINSFHGIVKDTAKEGIIEPIDVKKQAILSATECSSLILRIDDIIAAKTLRENTLPDSDF